jgi:hypothetical protein
MTIVAEGVEVSEAEEEVEASTLVIFRLQFHVFFSLELDRRPLCP